MLGYLFRTSAVLVIALAAAAAARRRPAAIRHFVLSTALAGLLLLPLLSLVPFGWRTTLLPAEAPASTSVPAAATAARPADISPAASAGPSAASVTARGHGPFPVEIAGRPPAPGELTMVFSPTEGATDGRTGEAQAPAAGPAGGAAVARVVDFAASVLWPAGALLLLLRLAVGLMGALRLTSGATALAGPGWRALVERFLALVPLRRAVRLKSHPDVAVPLTWGWRRPVVLFPEGADGWSEEERSSALFHELSHIKRADFLVMLLVRTSLALFWWNPLCWIAYRELLEAQELACDELVLRAGIKPSAYAACLLAFRRAAGPRWNPSAALLGLAGRSSFQERLASILKTKIVRMEVKMRTKITVAAALVAAVSVVGMARPAAAPRVGEPITVVAETPLPPAPAAALEAAAPAQTAAQEKAKEAEKAKQAEKAKKAEEAARAEKGKAIEKTIVIKPVEVDGLPLEIVITEGGEVKTLKIDKPLTITTEKGGGAIVLKIDGQEARVLKGEPLRLEIKGGELEFVKEGRPVRIVEGKDLAETEEILTKDGVIHLKARPEGGRAFSLAKTAEGGEVTVVVEREKEGEPTIVWTNRDGGKGKAVWVAKSAKGEPTEMTWTAKPAIGHALALTSDKEMLDKVRALQEQVQAIKAKKMDLSALEESLKKLEAELKAKEEKLRSFEFEFDKAPGEFKIVKRGDKGEAGVETMVWTEKEGRAARAAKTKVTVATTGKDEGAINLVFTGHRGEAGKAAFERSVAALKKALPEGYSVAEQEFDEEDGTIRFKVAAPEGKKADETLVKTIVDAVRSALDKT
jgi:beta-lactamase regulating signal transducer with metallopeptidase domain